MEQVDPKEPGRAPDVQHHEADAPARISDEEAHRRAAEQARRTRRLLDVATGGPRPPLAGLGVALVLVVSAWLAVATGTLYPEETRAGPERDGSIAVVMALSTLWAWLMPVGRRVAAVIPFGLGIALVAIGIFESNTTFALHVHHVVTGALAIIGSLLCLLSPERETPG